MGELGGVWELSESLQTEMGQLSLTLVEGIGEYSVSMASTSQSLLPEQICPCATTPHGYGFLWTTQQDRWHFFDGDTDAELFTFPKANFGGERLLAWFLIYGFNGELRVYP